VSWKLRLILMIPPPDLFGRRLFVKREPPAVPVVQNVKKEEKSIPLQGELEGAKPASNQIKRPEKPAQQAFGERSENFCEAKVMALFRLSGKSEGLF